MNFIFEVHLQRTTNPLGSISNPEGSKNDEPSGFEIEPRGFEDRTPLGSISNPEGFEDRTLLGSCLRTHKGSCLRTLLGSRSNPEGSIFEPSGFHEPRGFVLRTLWVPRTQKGSYLRTLLGSRSNPEGFDLEPSGFHEPRRVRRSNPPGFRTLWVRGTQRVRSRTQKGSKIRTLLGSWNAEGSKIEPFWVRDRTQRVRSSNPSGFEIEPRRVRSSNPLGSISNPEGSWFFEDELRR
ncbi:hypothetical protein ACOSQ2_012151 [Xanthoceras sorbifolium]